MSKRNIKRFAGTINRGIGHNIKKHKPKLTKSKTLTHKNKKRAGSQKDAGALFSVKFSAGDNAAEDGASQTPGRRFFRSRTGGRKSTVSLSNGDVGTKPRVADKGVCSPSTASSLHQLSLRRSPRKSVGQQQQQSDLRRSPRKLASRFVQKLDNNGDAGHSTAGPTRLLFSDTKCDNVSAMRCTGSPKKLMAHSVQTRRTSPRKRPRLDQNGDSREQPLMMEKEEDKENESPTLSPASKNRKLKTPKFYSIFYREEQKCGLETPAEIDSSSAQSPSTAKTNKSVTSHSRCQMIIDAGQSQFGAVTCDTCGLVYFAGDQEDAALHAQHHAGFLSDLQFPGWKKENVVGEYMDGRIVMVSPSDPQYSWRKVAAVLSIVDKELGCVGVSIRNRQQTKVFMYISERRIRGCLVAESVSEAHRVLSDTTAVRHPDTCTLIGGQMQNAPLTCSSDVCACVCGVSRVWVERNSRRCGIASRLLNALRCNYTMIPLSWNDIAFQDPTRDGCSLAAAITATNNFLVYCP